MLSPFQQALGNAKLSFLTLGLCLLASVVLNICLAISLAHAPRHMQVSISGVKGTHTVHFGEILPSSAYAFALNNWLSLNNWKVSGEINAKEQISALYKLGYITPAFLNEYITILKGIDNQGFAKRYRLVSLANDGGVYLPSKVYKDGDSYIVTIQMDSLFYYNLDDESAQGSSSANPSFDRSLKALKTRAVKKIVATYQIRVVPFANDVGMALGGIVSVRVNSQQDDFTGDA